jgi:hypothetical protein
MTLNTLITFTSALLTDVSDVGQVFKLVRMRNEVENSLNLL